MKYIQKEVREIEGFQFGVDETPNWFIEKKKEGEVYRNEKLDIVVKTLLEGDVIVNIGDYIIRGIGLYSLQVYRKEPFERLYTKVEK